MVWPCSLLGSSSCFFLRVLCLKNVNRVWGSENKVAGEISTACSWPYCRSSSVWPLPLGANRRGFPQNPISPRACGLGAVRIVPPYAAAPILVAIFLPPCNMARQCLSKCVNVRHVAFHYCLALLRLKAPLCYPIRGPLKAFYPGKSILTSFRPSPWPIVSRMCRCKGLRPREPLLLVAKIFS
jgi:hypothetical protein